MGKKTFNNGSHVLKSPPLDPFYIEKDSDFHPNLRHYPDYRRSQYDQYRSQFIPKVFKPVPMPTIYQTDYNADMCNNEAFKNFRSCDEAKCMKAINTRDFDILLNDKKTKKSQKNDNDDSFVISGRDLSSASSKTSSNKRPVVKNLTIYDTTYNRMNKIGDVLEIEKNARLNQGKKKEEHVKDNMVDFLNRGSKDLDIFTNSSSQFSKVVDESKILLPYPNFPAPQNIYHVFHTAKPDFRTTNSVFHNNRQFNVEEPDIYKIRKQIFDDEQKKLNNILEKYNNNIKNSHLNVNVNIYNP